MLSSCQRSSSKLPSHHCGRPSGIQAATCAKQELHVFPNARARNIDHTPFPTRHSLFQPESKPRNSAAARIESIGVHLTFGTHLGRGAAQSEAARSWPSTSAGEAARTRPTAAARARVDCSVPRVGNRTSPCSVEAIRRPRQATSLEERTHRRREVVACSEAGASPRLQEPLFSATTRTHHRVEGFSEATVGTLVVEVVEGSASGRTQATHPLAQPPILLSLPPRVSSATLLDNSRPGSAAEMQAGAASLGISTRTRIQPPRKPDRCSVAELLRRAAVVSSAA